MPRPSRSTFTMPISAQSSLSHCTTTRPGIVAGSSGTTESSCPWHTTIPPECCPRWRGKSCTAWQSSKNLRIRRCCRSRPASRNWRVERVVGGPCIPTSRPGWTTIERFRIERQSLADFARRRAAAIGDHVRGHGRAQFPVALVDILNGAFPLIAAGQIEIDVRPFAALLGKKSLEEQVHADRIDGRNAQRVANGAVGRRTAPLHQNIFLAAEANDVPDDQKIAGQIELFDQRQLAIDLPPRAFVIRRRSGKSCLRACAGEEIPSANRPREPDKTGNSYPRSFSVNLQARGKNLRCWRWLREDRRKATPFPRAT